MIASTHGTVKSPSDGHLNVAVDDAQAMAVIHCNDELLEELASNVLRQRRSLHSVWHMRTSAWRPMRADGPRLSVRPTVATGQHA